MEINDKNGKEKDDSDQDLRKSTSWNNPNTSIKIFSVPDKEETADLSRKKEEAETTAKQEDDD